MALFGFVGGIWLWQYLTNSELITKYRRYIKIFGLIGLILIFIITGISFYMYTFPESILRNSISFLNYIMIFILAYLLGYDYSIFKKEPLIEESEHKKNTDNSNASKNFKITIDWSIVKNIGLSMIILLILFFGPLFMVGIYGNRYGIYGDILSLSMQIFYVIAICIIGFGIALINWEHIKKSGLIKGKFRFYLIILSIITTVIAGFILGYGIYAIYYGGSYFDLQIIVLMISLFIECIGFYFLGLLISIFIQNK